MRFRKSIRISKGIRLNLSKSGGSITIGGKGLSLNLGSNGVYLNTGIPGTGLYDRKKLFGRDNSRAAEPATPDPRNYDLQLQEDGTVEVYHRSGRPATEQERKQLQRTEWYAWRSAQLMEQLRDELQQATAVFTELYKASVTVPAGTGLPESAIRVENAVEAWLNGVSLPMRFSVDYDYDPQRGNLMVDLDLPEIEDLPENTVALLSSGKMKAKDKSKKELRGEYSACVLGLAIYLTSHLFSLSEGLQGVLISGYTQRRNAKTGEMQDDYVCSIAFPREAFEDDTCIRESPEDFCNRWRSRIKIADTGEMKTIVPYTADELETLLG